MQAAATTPPVLLLPHGAPDTIARGLLASIPPGVELVAVLVPLPEANATAVLLRDRDGAPVDVDAAAVAAAMSTGGFEVGLACGGAEDADRCWQGFRDGRPDHRLGPEDEPWLPVDEDGFPDLEAPRRTIADGIPAGFGRVRTCHDLGMSRVFSCRFGPVEWTLQRAARGEDVGAQAYLLAPAGHRAAAPVRLPWSGAGQPR